MAYKATPFERQGTRQTSESREQNAESRKQSALDEHSTNTRLNKEQREMRVKERESHATRHTHL